MTQPQRPSAPQQSTLREKIILVCALGATALVYWAGLHGPFILDDDWNLAPIRQWAQGEATWQYAVWGNTSGPLGRPLAMASFLLNVALGGYSPFAIKLGNLVVHLLCGVLAWGLLRQVLRRDSRMAAHAGVLASVLAAIWLLHPFNASTVLYAVQRMAQLSTLFVLAALWAYVAFRSQLADGHVRRAAVGLFVVVPALVLAGMLSKENAAVAPLMMLVLELAYFTGRESARPKPAKRMVIGFYTLFLLLPLVVGLLTRLRPERLLSGFASRDFTLVERLLTQPRVLVDYLGMLLLPRGPRMGVIHDDYVLSTGLLSPPATMLAIVLLAALTAGALALRRRAPAVFAGWFLFLAAHSMESSVLALELYFEHRNYLPAVGLWLAVAGLAEYATRGLRAAGRDRARTGGLAAGAFVLLLAVATLGRVHVWQSEDRLYTQALAVHPTSLRAITVNFEYGLRTGNIARVEDGLRRYLASDDPHIRQVGHLARIRYHCLARVGADPQDVQDIVALAQPKVTLLVQMSIETITNLGPGVDCGPVTPLVLARMTDDLADASVNLSDNAIRKWRMRLLASRLYARAGRWDLALEQARMGWQPSADAPAGAFLVRAYAHNGMLREARRVLAETQVRVDPRNLEYAKGLTGLKVFLDNMEQKAPPTPLPDVPAG